MVHPQTFSDAVLAMLRQTRWRPDAQRTFDGTTGGFVWNDELPDEIVQMSLRLNDDAYRCVIGYRASLIAGEPREELRGPWDQLLEVHPAWPGFRPERRSPELLGAMERANGRFMASLRRINKLCE